MAAWLDEGKSQIDLWLKDIAPSNALRKWFAHDPRKWAEFQARYAEELKAHAEQVATLRHEARRGPVTLLYGAKDEEHNQAVVLKKMLHAK